MLTSLDARGSRCSTRPNRTQPHRGATRPSEHSSIASVPPNHGYKFLYFFPTFLPDPLNDDFCPARFGPPLLFWPRPLPPVRNRTALLKNVFTIVTGFNLSPCSRSKRSLRIFVAKQAHAILMKRFGDTFGPFTTGSATPVAFLYASSNFDDFLDDVLAIYVSTYQLHATSSCLISHTHAQRQICVTAREE